MPDLGSLEKINLRSVWENEAQDFTPWLAQEENLNLLGDTIGIELQLDSTEKSVGPFNADVLCKDTVDDQWVLIENQLERTDHPHLGQLLTYAAGLDAVTIVWVARQFSDQHRSALDWLNKITDEDINFFGLEIELWQIGDSPPAPKFNIVSKPNDWSETVSSAARGEELNESDKLRREYWATLKERLESRESRVQPRTPRPNSWARYAVGRTRCRLTARISSRSEMTSVELTLTDDAEAEPLFHLLQADRETIEEEIGEELDWQPKPNKKRFVVAYEWPADPTDREAWPQQHRKLAEMLDAFHRAFAPRLRRLNPENWTGETDEPPAEEADVQNEEPEATHL